MVVVEMNTPPFPLDYCPMRGRKVVTQSGAGRVLLFQSESATFFRLDEIGSLVWSLCDGSHSVSEIVNRLCSQYDASMETIQGDMMELLSEMAAQKLLLPRQPA